MKLTVKQLKDTVITPKCVEYFLADPKEKQKMIVNDQLKGDI